MAYEAAEEGLFRLLNGAGSNPALDAAALFLDVSALLYIMLLWSIHLWIRNRRALGFDLAVCLVVTALVTEALKFAIGRDRPVDVYGAANVNVIAPWFLPDVSDPAFPSGHTSRAFAFAFLLGLHERRWIPFLVPWAALVGIGRVYEGAHYPSDVLGGALVGIAFGAMWWWMDRWPPYVRLRQKLVGRWLSPAPGGSNGSTPPLGPGPT